MDYGLPNTMNPQNMQPSPYGQPSPYMAGTNTQPVGMAQGGNVAPRKSGGYTLAHFSKHELPALDDWQGGAKYLKGGDIRDYSGIEKRFASGDHVFSDILNRHLADQMRSGKIHEIKAIAAQMKPMGRHGDNAVAWIGPKTRAYLDHYSGGSVNPYTGGPEYWSLGGMLGSIGSGLKSAAGTVGRGMTSVGNVLSPLARSAGNAIGSRFGIPNAGDIGTDLWNGAGQTLSNIGGGGDQAPQPGAGQQGGAQGSDEAPSEGQAGFIGPQQQPQAPQSFMQKAGNLVNRGQQFMASPMGQNLMSGAKQAYNTYQGGGGKANALMSGINKTAQGFDNPAARFVQGATEQGNPGNVRANIGRGINSATMGVDNPIIRGIGEGAEDYGQNGNIRQAGQHAYNRMRQPSYA